MSEVNTNTNNDNSIDKSEADFEKMLLKLQKIKMLEVMNENHQPSLNDQLVPLLVDQNKQLVQMLVDVCQRLIDKNT